MALCNDTIDVLGNTTARNSGRVRCQWGCVCRWQVSITVDSVDVAGQTFQQVLRAVWTGAFDLFDHVGVKVDQIGSVLQLFVTISLEELENAEELD